MTNRPIGPAGATASAVRPALSHARKGNELLTRDDIERETDGGITRRWLELAAHRGDGPPMLKISRRMVRYRRDAFEAWLDSFQTEGRADA